MSVGKRSLRNASSTYTITDKSVSESEFPGAEEIRKMLKSGEKPEYILQTLVTSMDSCDIEEVPMPRERIRSVVNLPTFIRQSETVGISSRRIGMNVTSFM